MSEPNQAELPPTDPFAEAYPNIARWTERGWIEFGRGYFNFSFLQVMSEKGLVWEGKKRYRYATLHEAFLDADAALADWFAKNEQPEEPKEPEESKE